MGGPRGVSCGLPLSWEMDVPVSRPELRVVEGGREGSRESLGNLYAGYGGAVYGRCVYLLKDRARAEDAMQEVFARALAHLPEFRRQASPLTWLMKIATHHCLNELRSEKAGWRALFEWTERSRPEGHGGPAVLEDREAVRRLLSHFDRETQAAAVHYHVDGMTLEEVAEVLGRSVPTIRKRLEAFAQRAGKELS